MECNKVHIHAGVDVISDQLVQKRSQVVQSQLHLQRERIATALEEHERLATNLILIDLICFFLETEP
jgi:hypothetical protein